MWFFLWNTGLKTGFSPPRPHPTIKNFAKIFQSTLYHDQCIHQINLSRDFNYSYNYSISDKSVSAWSLKSCPGFIASNCVTQFYAACFLMLNYDAIIMPKNCPAQLLTNLPPFSTGTGIVSFYLGLCDNFLEIFIDFAQECAICTIINKYFSEKG